MHELLLVAMQGPHSVPVNQSYWYQAPTSLDLNACGLSANLANSDGNLYCFGAWVRRLLRRPAHVGGGGACGRVWGHGFSRRRRNALSLAGGLACALRVRFASHPYMRACRQTS